LQSTRGLAKAAKKIRNESVESSDEDEQYTCIGPAEARNEMRTDKVYYNESIGAIDFVIYLELY
jgi:hypothetical protein